MEFFDTLISKSFAAGLYISQAFAVLLYLSIVLLTVYTAGQTAWWLLAS